MHPDRRHRFTQPPHHAAPTLWGRPKAADIPLRHMPLLTADHNLFRIMIAREVKVWKSYWFRYSAVPCTPLVYMHFLDQSKAVVPSSAPPPAPIRGDANRAVVTEEQKTTGD